MNDITLDELKAQLPTDIAAVFTSVTLPAGTTVNEFLNKIIMSANKAATVKNAGLAAGERIASYPNPNFSAVQLVNGAYVQTQTSSIVSRLPVNFDEASAVNA